MKRNPAINKANSCALLVVGGVLFGMVAVLCGIVFLVSALSSPAATPAPNAAVLSLAYSSEKDALMQDIIARFNRSNYKNA